MARLPRLEDRRTPIPDPALYAGPLSQLQANILRGHGHSRANHLLLRFQDAAAARAALARLPVTPATAPAGEPYVGVGISARGYAQLGWRFPVYNLSPLHAADLRLPPGDFQAPAWQHLSAVVIVAAGAELDELTRSIAARFAEVGSLALEPGAAFHDAAGHVVEHFGFRDGLSQPCFFANEAAWPGDEAGPYSVLFPDPCAPGGVGSFLVMLKIAQDVAAFHRAVELLRPHAPEAPESCLMGRRPDGRPLAEEFRGTNEFAYAPDDSRCPFAAHARKMAPRLGLPGERASRIARRGITYGPRWPEGGPAAERGLLFQCVQRDIRSQFRELFVRWANDPDFPAPGHGRDVLLTHHPPRLTVGGAVVELPRLIRVLGGESFFLPSLPFLRARA